MPSTHHKLVKRNACKPSPSQLPPLLFSLSLPRNLVVIPVASRSPSFYKQSPKTSHFSLLLSIFPNILTSEHPHYLHLSVLSASFDPQELHSLLWPQSRQIPAPPPPPSLSTQHSDLSCHSQVFRGSRQLMGQETHPKLAFHFHLLSLPTLPFTL